MGRLRITAAEVAADGADIAALRRFYVEQLGFAPAAGSGERLAAGERLALNVGDGVLRFAAHQAPERPFHHFALLVPGDRQPAARDWITAEVPLLTRPGQTSTVFAFRDWDAEACYFHDPAGNIVELIAHHGRAESGRSGRFSAAELLGISEVGLVVTDLSAAGERLLAAGVEMWSGSLAGADALGFFGRQAHTLILCAPTRPWLPTGRPAQSHAITAALQTTAGEVEIRLRDGELRVTGP
ncbi:MAG: hypothetical protein WBQ18_08355 [Solirubrobacteraceae bacterium]